MGKKETEEKKGVRRAEGEGVRKRKGKRRWRKGRGEKHVRKEGGRVE